MGFQPLAYAGLSLGPITPGTRRGSRGFELTPKEFDLLQILLRHPRQVLTREQILETVWGYDFGGDDNVLEPGWVLRILRGEDARPAPTEDLLNHEWMQARNAK